MPNSLSRRAAFLLAAAVAALCSIALAAAFAGATPVASADHPSHAAHDFERFLQRYEAANTAFVNGDPSPWLSLTAAKDPVSIFGGFGGLGAAGVADVHQRYLLAATAFRPSGAKVDFEYLVKDVHGRLAYTVAIERSSVLYTGRTETQPQILRVTMLFRRERGDWKIVHRHADTMVGLQLPAA
jgi:ketosteroid isomerase-like protein